MEQFQSWHTEALALHTVEALKRNHFKAVYFPRRAQALEYLLTIVPSGATIGIGGSWTIKELQLDELLEKRGHTIYNHNKPGLNPDESLAVRRKELTCDVFFSSTNALTLDGKLVNVDGAGNRTSAMVFGPQKVVIIAGLNKIVRDVEDAENRIKLFVAPTNNKRLNNNNPCTQTGICADCQSPKRICNITTVIHKKPMFTDMEIVMIGERLGF